MDITKYMLFIISIKLYTVNTYLEVGISEFHAFFSVNMVLAVCQKWGHKTAA